MRWLLRVERDGKILERRPILLGATNREALDTHVEAFVANHPDFGWVLGQVRERGKLITLVERFVYPLPLPGDIMDDR